MKFAPSQPTADETERQLSFDNYASIGYRGEQLKGGQTARYLGAP